MGAAKKKEETGHTPGPWSASNNHEKERLEIRGSDGTWLVCNLPARHPVDAANALLIASAPALLAALEDLADKMRSDGWDDASLADARAAIAKARGES